MVLFSGLWSFGHGRREDSEEGEHLLRSIDEDGGNYEEKSNTSHADDDVLNPNESASDSSRANLTEEFDSFLETDETLKLCLLYVAIYFAIAIVAYCYVFERWSIIDGLYFAVNTFTTCGYVTMWLLVYLFVICHYT